MEAKSNLRQKLRQYFSQVLPDRDRDAESRAVAQRVSDVVKMAAVQNVGVYQALSDEVALDAISNGSAVFKARFFSPKVVADDLSFYHFNRLQDLVVGAFGILEPAQDGPNQLPKDFSSAVIVPGVAFDRSGRRLGRGKGFYDRFLMDFKGIKIGVCQSYRVLEELPVEPHDVAMDYVVTEKFVLRPVVGRSGRVK